MQNFGRENFDDSTCIRQNSSDFSTIKVLRYTVSPAHVVANTALLFLLPADSLLTVSMATALESWATLMDNSVESVDGSSFEILSI